MSRLRDALKAFSKTYHEAAPVRDGDCHDEAEEMDAWPLRRDPKNTVSSGGYRVLDSEGDSRRGAASDGYPVDKSQPEDPMEPGWNGAAGDDDEQPALRQLRSAKVRVQCPHCDQTNTVRLPKHLQLAYAGEGEDGEAYASEGKSRILRTQCGKCGETVRFHAPEGHKFSNRESAAVSHFNDRYRYLTGRGGSIVRGLRSAREAFRRSYFGGK